MTQLPSGMRVCPTRVDETPALFAHAVTLPMCQSRQREQYHKCFTCVHNNARTPPVPTLPPRVNGTNGIHLPVPVLPVAESPLQPHAPTLQRVSVG